MSGLILIIGITVLYFIGIFLLSFWIDFSKAKKSLPMVKKLPASGHGIMYALSLCVYCTSWSYYGSVGKAATGGVLFLAIYLGPTLLLTVGTPFYIRLIQLRDLFKVTSVVDLISTRYHKSRGLGAFATLITVVGMVPYAALQLKAVTATSMVLNAELIHGTAPLLHSIAWQEFRIGLGAAIVMAAFTIVLGLRKLDTSERHPGLIAMVIVETMVKLVAFLAIGVAITYGAHHGYAEVFKSLTHGSGRVTATIGAGSVNDCFNWITLLLLSACAMALLPRQFQVAIVENQKISDLKTARWLTPAYFLAINFFVLAIALLGLQDGLPGHKAESFTLLWPLKQGWPWLAAVAFVGGVSAAFSMVILETVAIATMISNHLALPLVSSFEALKGMRSKTLLLRWSAAVGFIFSALGYMLAVGDSIALVSMGLISFAAMLIFVPAVVGGLYWRAGTKAGAWASLISGFGLWGYTLFIPAFMKSGQLPAGILTTGPWGLSWLRPEALFGLEGLDPLTHATFWSLAIGSTSYVLFSLLSEPNAIEKLIAARFHHPQEAAFGPTPLGSLGQDTNNLSILKTKQNLREHLTGYMGPELIEEIISDAMRAIGIPELAETLNVAQFGMLLDQVETAISARIGRTTAGMVIRKVRPPGSELTEALAIQFARLLLELQLDPKELNDRIDLYKERELLLRDNEQRLQHLVEEKSQELADQRELSMRSSRLLAIGEIAAGIAHEINNPLANIKGYLGRLETLLRTGTLTHEKAVKILQISRDSSDRIARIIKSLKTLSRDGANDEFHEAFVSEIIDDALALCQVKFKNSNIQFHMPEVDPSLSINCQAVQICQVLVNLLNNAYDAVQEQPAHLPRWIRVGVARASDALWVRVVDSGTGIAPEIEKKIMQPFFTTKEVGHGTGLGLSLSLKIMQQHGGNLFMEHPAAHTTFVLEFPCKSTKSAAEPVRGHAYEHE